MKKYFFGGIAATVIAAAVTLNMNIGAKGDSFSDTFLANVEALAGNEAGHIDIWCCAPFDRTCVGDENITIYGNFKTRQCD